ncbi:signal transduction histidine kinase [Mycolicibacterium phlei]|jgi:two-component system NarL family sensor kinase|uniref:histidine kinase n=1 Tax=Mycolicibacterium phlei DSM 43239 = CCUG 21000 TaxID=1226750 RepID=A0A5N5V1Q3_MYCPH|nr:ATP-binding protein [Mycolicibacterium phlei]VEG07054.1 signal transduction histidine kinase [Mycobacteroides chelonae]AMO58922.1 Sensor histidine kinase ComP [Mycolicibacterium phlei]EID09418.1 signal transduction histidine kinase [Mycolicibacterium phlei RIVM601174]KAB7754549.1 ATPase [Mycolicibacterium phlei DSM 43239 = CCUG 21000]KXW59962.1 ATPase [Mycolicibacterium phlei DSM 43070]
MATLADRLTRLFAAEPVRVTAVLRLPLIMLVAILVWIWEVDHWLPEVYVVVLGTWAVAAVIWLVLVSRSPTLPRWADWASTGIDVLVVAVLCLVSGGATAALLPVFFLLPIAVAFQDRPVLTAVLGVGTAVTYLAVWIVYSKRDDNVGLPNVVYTQFGFLLWSAVAMTALCVVLVRRQARVLALQELRRQLVSEAMQADERHNREVAEHLHDGPLQTLLAARLDLDEVRERVDDPALEAARDALQQTAAALRSTVTELHPQVLAQLGLTPAVRELLRQFESRGRYMVEAELEEVGKPESQQLLYRAARELLNNIHKHAGATTVRVTLSRVADRILLTVADDGRGFDPAVIGSYVADGHIGLGSLLARFEAMGGSMQVQSTAGKGTTVIATSPPEP